MSGVDPAPPPSAPRSPEARRIAAPSWLDLRLVLGILLVLAAVVAGAKVVSSARQTYPTVAARHDLEAGTVLSAADLRLARVQLPDHGHGVYLSRLKDAVGRQLTRPVSAGELVPSAAVGRVRALTTMTVPLAAGAAPQLRKGERIELWVSAASCSSVVLLRDEVVQAVHAAGGGSFDAGTGGQDVVISVAPALAERVITALALDDAKVRAGVLIGSPDGGDDQSALPPLDPCIPAPGR
jgi:SAF domain